MSHYWAKLSILIIAIIISLMVNTIYLWVSFSDIYGSKIRKKEKQFKRVIIDAGGMIMVSVILIVGATLSQYIGILIDKLSAKPPKATSSSTVSTAPEPKEEND